MFVGTWSDDGTGFVNDRDPELFMRGRMGPVKVEIGPSQSLFSVEVEDIRSMLDRVNGLRSTLLEHNETHADDMFYEFLSSMTDHTFVFNGRDFAERRGGTSDQDNTYGPGSPRWEPYSDR
jgi:hypothetical protein